MVKLEDRDGLEVMRTVEGDDAVQWVVNAGKLLCDIAKRCVNSVWLEGTEVPVQEVAVEAMHMMLRYRTSGHFSLD